MARSVASRRASLALGSKAEQWVATQLELEGWRILARNWSSAGGELDLVVHREGQLRFVEVKARNPRDPNGDEAVDPRKRRRLIRAAHAWLATDPTDWAAVCFAVAVVRLDDTRWSMDWIDDAFDA